MTGFNDLRACTYKEAKRFVRYRVEDADLNFKRGRIDRGERDRLVRSARTLLRKTFPSITHTRPPEAP